MGCLRDLKLNGWQHKRMRFFSCPLCSPLYPPPLLLVLFFPPKQLRIPLTLHMGHVASFMNRALSFTPEDSDAFSPKVTF